MAAWDWIIQKIPKTKKNEINNNNNNNNKKLKLHQVRAIPIPVSTTNDGICWSNGYIYFFFDYAMLLLFVNANVTHHVSERGAFVGDNAKGAHG